MHLSENEGIEGTVFLVTGGLGFVGSALCLELVRRGAAEVRSFDLRSDSPRSADLLNSQVRCIQGDVRKRKDVERALSGVDCVFHLASFGKSGKQTLEPSRTDSVNIDGTCNILEACHEFGVTRLVFASTYNVIFGGREIVCGDESLPYFPIEDHVDPYGRSKSLAEQLILRSNGRQSKKKDSVLFTCAVRPATIYGPGEEQNLSRMIGLAKKGLFLFKIGEANVKTDWIYIDNLVLGLILASMGLLNDLPGRKGQPIAAGKSYFISDGSPVNTFEFIGPLLRSLNYDLPKRTLSVQQAMNVAYFFSFIYTILRPWLDSRWLPQPLLLPPDVHKVGITHYFSYMRAKEELGYTPMISPKEGMAATISHWKEKKKKKIDDGPSIYAWTFSTVGMLLTFYAAFLPPWWPLAWVNFLAFFFFRSLAMTRLVFIVAAALHVGEGIYAWFLSKRVDPENSTAWFWQTFALGFFSLRFLLKKARAAK